MAKFIDLGQKKADDPIFTEGIRFISIRKPKLPVGAVIPNGPCPDPTPTNKETPHEPSN